MDTSIVPISTVADPIAVQTRPDGAGGTLWRCPACGQFRVSLLANADGSFACWVCWRNQQTGV
jgi:hypothetical protein